MPRTAGWLGVVACCFVSAHAYGQALPNDGIKSAAAQALFDEGRQLVQVGRFSEACPKLAESQRLEAAAGTLLNLALCHEKEGKTATAWLEYNDALMLAVREADSERRAIARQRIDALEPLLSRLVLLLPKNPPDDLWIELDDVRLGSEAWHTGVPVDPRSHVVRAGAEGKVTATVSVDVARTPGNIQLQLPELTDTPPSVRAPEQPALPAHHHEDTRLRTAVDGAALGVGVSGLIMATYFGLHAQSQWQIRNQHCRSGCDEQAVMAGHNAKSAALLSTVSAGVGLLALGFATYLFVTSPHEDDEKMVRLRVGGELAAGHASVTAVGEF